MSKDKVTYTLVAKNEENNIKLAELKINEAPPGYGKRHTQAVIMFISLTVAIMIRSHISISIVAMTGTRNSSCSFVDGTDDNSTPSRDDTNALLVESDSLMCNTENAVSTKWGVTMTNDWNKATQEMIVFSFVVGYMLAMVPGGILVQRIGWRRPVAFALFTNGIISVLSPWLSTLGGWLALCTCRFVQGVTQCFFFPSIHTVLAKWAPLSEKGRLNSFIYNGCQFGIIAAFQTSGFLAGSDTFGWPVNFWLCGVLCFVSCWLVIWLGVDTPSQHSTISREELMYITGTASSEVVNKKRLIPWKQILNCKAVWAIVIAEVGYTIVILFTVIETPIYLSHVLHVDLKNNGLFSSLPFIVMYFTNLLFGFVSDYCIKNGYLSVVNVRRIANTIGMVVSGLFLVAFTFVDNTFVAVSLLILHQGFISAIYVGFHINHVDLAPEFAGTLIAMCNMVSHLMSLLNPVMISNIIGDDLANKSKWQTIAMMLFGLLLITNTFYVIFAKGEVQDWNYYNQERNDTLKEEMQLKEPEIRKDTADRSS